MEARWKFKFYDGSVLDLWESRQIATRFEIDPEMPVFEWQPLSLSEDGAIIISQEGELNWIGSKLNTPRSGSHHLVVIDNGE